MTIIEQLVKTKKCGRCLKVKPLTEFHKTKSHSENRSWDCKVCKSVICKTDKYRERKRWRYYNPLDPNRPPVPKIRVRSAKPVESRARDRFSNEMKKGCIKKPTKCSQCGDVAKLHGHHEDYTKPLEVIWLCIPCHRQKHKAMKLLVGQSGGSLNEH